MANFFEPFRNFSTERGGPSARAFLRHDVTGRADGPPILASTCITGVRLITETIGGGIACQIHMLAKTRFHLTSHLLFTVPSKRDKVPVWGKSCSQIEVCWILKMMAQAQPHRQSLGPGEFCRVFELGQRHIITGTAASLDIVMNTHGEICDLTACNPCIA